MEGVSDGAATFDALRPKLVRVAYRMLGSMADAEDVVQEAWLRWQATDRRVVRDAPAFLVTTTTRLALNAACSARARHERSLVRWLPEPPDASADPERALAHGEALDLAISLLLEKLAPGERAAFVLRRAFDYAYADIADLLDVSEANARQLASRARKHLVAERCWPTSAAAQRRLLAAFAVAAHDGELAALETLLRADVAADVRYAAKPTLSRREAAENPAFGGSVEGAEQWPNARSTRSRERPMSTRTNGACTPKRECYRPKSHLNMERAFGKPD